MLATHGGAKHFGSRYQIKLANEDYLKELKK